MQIYGFFIQEYISIFLKTFFKVRLIEQFFYIRLCGWEKIVFAKQSQRS